MLQLVNRKLEQWMPLLTPFSVGLGLLFPHVFSPLTFLVSWLFGFMTFTGSLGSNFKDLKKIVLAPWPLLLALATLHVLMPVYAWALSSTVFHGDPYTLTGLVLIFVLPTGIVSFMWVSIYKGNIALTLSIILIDTLLSPIVVPTSLSLVVGASIHIQVWSMMKGLLWMVVIPSLLAMATNQLTRGKAKTVLSPKLSPFSKIGLAFVVAINSSVVAPYIHKLDLKLLLIIVLAFCIAASGYLIGWGLAKLFRFDQTILIALTFNSGMRNNSAGAVIAIQYFPAPVALPVIAITLFQQILASTYGYLLQRSFSRETRLPGAGHHENFGR